MAKVVFQESLCKGCELCRQACPKKIITMSRNINEMGYHPAVQTKPEECTGCAICALVCPDLVITVSREE